MRSVLNFQHPFDFDKHIHVECTAALHLHNLLLLRSGRRDIFMGTYSGFGNVYVHGRRHAYKVRICSCCTFRKDGKHECIGILAGTGMYIRACSCSARK
jgi:hypothetical protein